MASVPVRIDYSNDQAWRAAFEAVTALQGESLADVMSIADPAWGGATEAEMRQTGFNREDVLVCVV